MSRRVFITGLTGFAGSHRAEHLAGGGDEVHALAHEDPPYPYLAAVARDVTVHRGDITRYDDLRAALGGARPDVVVHLAGLAVPALAQRDPRSAVSVNVPGAPTMIAVLAGQPGTPVLAAARAPGSGTPHRAP